MRRRISHGFLLTAVLMPPLWAEDLAHPPTTVVLELFTSQGCSSCPPADTLLTELGKHDEIIALAFHVDYWNHLGWRDPFSQRSWSRRQERYAEAQFRGRVYTPQLIVNGRTHVVGSNRTEVAALLQASQTEQPKAALRLKWQPGQPVAHIEAKLDFRVDGKLDLNVAIVENGLDTAVARGENARRKLHNDFIVRSLETVASLAGTPGSTHHSYQIPARWQGKGVQLVAFLQHPDSMQIFAGAKSAVPR